MGQGSTTQSEEPIKDIDAFALEKVARMNALSAYGVSDRVMQEVTCSRYMEPVMQRWSSLLSPKFDLENHREKLIKTETRKVFDNDKASDVTFADKTSFRNLVGVSLHVNRKSPFDIDEAFARYRVTVHQLDANHQQLTPALYDGLQFSCPTHDAHFFEIPLQNFEPVEEWLSNNATDLELRVRIEPRSQEFYGNEGFDEQGILLNVTCMSILQRLPSESRSIGMLQNALLSQAQRIYEEEEVELDAVDDDEDEEEMNSHHRERRSASSRRSPCQKVSYKLDFNFYRDDWNVRYPPSHEIFECAGRCGFPLSGHLNSTNHAIAIKTDRLVNENRPRDGTVNCVPISYKHFYYLEFSEHEVLQTAFSKEMIVENCGCR